MTDHRSRQPSQLHLRRWKKIRPFEFGHSEGQTLR